MTEWPGEILGRAEGPRPLRPEIRDQIEEALLTDSLSTETTTRPLGGDVSARLEDALDDPMADELAGFGGLDRPRSLRPATDRALQRAFARRSHRRRVAVAGAAAAVFVVAAGLTVAVAGLGRSPSKSPTEALAPQRSSGAASGSKGPGAASTNGSATAGSPSSASAAQAPQAFGSDRTATPEGPEAVTRLALTGVSPSSGSTSGGTEVTITGTGLNLAASVRFGTVPARFQIVSAIELRAVAPAHAAGVVALTVTTASGATLPSSNVRFTYH